MYRRMMLEELTLLRMRKERIVEAYFKLDVYFGQPNKLTTECPFLDLRKEFDDQLQ